MDSSRREQQATPRSPEPPRSRSRSRPAELLSRVSASLASPLGILLGMPGLVSLVGLLGYLLGEYALRSSNVEVAREHMAEQARLAAASVGEALSQAEPMLDRLYDLTVHHDAHQPPGPFAHALLDLMKGRPGVTYVSASFPDGTFQGAYVDDDGVIRFNISKVHADGTYVDRFDYGQRDQLVVYRRDRNGYDPRTRGFYVLATSEQKRIWTAPYVFWDSQATGVTRAAPVYADQDGIRKLHAVITIDFDVRGLSTYLSGRMAPGMRMLLYARDGSILAYAADSMAAPPLAVRSGSPIRFQDLQDPVLHAFFDSARHESGRPMRVLTVPVGEQTYLSAVAPVTHDPSLPWSLAYLVSERQVLRALHRWEDQSMMLTGLAVLVSALLAFAFARHILRVRAEAAEAKAEAREARAQAREAREEARELGSYRLVACLGKGGMGEVWRAQHRLLAREAAIKLIKTDSDATQSMRERFRREAEALARLRSRNTIELFDYGVADDGTFFLVMELLDGVDLDTLVVRYGVQPPARVVHLLIQACNSLAEAHSAGLVHRDIKPANLFVCRAADEVDVVKVLDFGLVRGASEPLAERVTQLELRSVASAGSTTTALDPTHSSARTQPLTPALTNPNGMVGTPAYMAPEQIQQQALDGRADLYALGGVAFWLLTGRLVFEQESSVEQLLAHVHAPLPELRARLGADVPDALVQLIAACLAKLPEQRPSDARALGRALKAITFPAEQQWSEERAQAWWRTRRPHPSEHPLASQPRELQVVAPTVSITRR